jgi:hypothetical protein
MKRQHMAIRTVPKVSEVLSPQEDALLGHAGHLMRPEVPATTTGREGEKTAIMIRLDAAIAARLTLAAKRFGITRTALIVQSLADRLFQLEKEGRI